MSSTIRLEIPDKNIRVEFTGSRDEVVTNLLKFLTNVYPHLSIVSRIVYTPDLESLLASISNHVKISDGEIIILDEENKTTENKILYLLAGCYAASKLGLREKNSMSIEEMVKMVSNISKKTIQNTLVELVKKGLVLRQARGTFEISTKGIMMLSGGIEGEGESAAKPTLTQ
ncbi:MAG: hypothetical protein QXN75_06195 [Thermoproteota archaeon]|nr:hypothetical protein [Candidatus Brockarchaeota archaeon]